MIYRLLFITILITSSYSNTINIDELQKEFAQNVLELNVYKKKSFLKFDPNYWNTIVSKLQMKELDLNSSQFISVVDLKKQLFIITFWDENKKLFSYIGNDFISSGNINREKEVKFGENHYLKTPTGVFISNHGWRSTGKKKKDNITLPYGAKDRYIFYFGKQETIRYNTFDKDRNKIYDQDKWKIISDTLDFAVHSHRSSKPMGKPYSHGCIRMTDELNKFLDNNSILHKNVFKNKSWIHKYAKKPKHSKYRDFAGEYLIIFDKI